MKCYLLSYANSLGSREEVKTALNTMGGVTSWRFDMPNAFYVRSEKSAGELARLLRAARGNRGRFFFTELVAGQYLGWLPPDTWKFIKNQP
jgi:hypothetical protein